MVSTKIAMGRNPDNNFVAILVERVTPKGHFETNCLLARPLEKKFSQLLIDAALGCAATVYHYLFCFTSHMDSVVSFKIHRE